jgi:AAA15 family ATPase/GTPase
LLTYFAVDNFRSINEPVELDLRANNYLKKHKNHVKSCGSSDNKTNVLRTALLYGANASGKSNIIKAITYAVGLVRNDDSKNFADLYEPFKTRINEPSNFYFEFFSGNFFYRFGFTVKRGNIIKEELHYTFGNKSIELYKREYDEDTKAYSIYSELAPVHDFTAIRKEQNFLSKNSDSNSSDKDIKSYEQFVQKTAEFSALLRFTPNNELFMSKLIEILNDDKEFILNTFAELACNFFSYQLLTILPEQRMSVFDWSDDSDSLEQRLKSFDSSIDKVVYSNISTERFPESLINNVRRSLASKEKISLDYKKNLYSFSLNENGEIQAKIVNTVHIIDGKEVSFSLADESDGTVRLLDLLPILYFAKDSEVTFIIDELDRSLHPLLAKRYMSSFLDNKSENCKSQLIITTHEAELLDNELVRRDEIFFTQKETDSATKLYSLDDYSERYDKDIHKAYLSGKYGAIPNLLSC